MSNSKSNKTLLKTNYEILGKLQNKNKDIKIGKTKNHQTNFLVFMKTIKYQPQHIDNNNKKKVENHYFIQDVETFKLANRKNLPFVHLVQSIPPKKNEDGYIITEFMKGGNLFYQIKINNQEQVNGYTLGEYISNSISNSFDDQDEFPNPFEKIKEPIQINKIPLDFTRKMIIIYGTAIAIFFLHINEIIHRDIKPENILLNEDGDPFVCDFELCKKINGKDKGSFVLGTAPYMAPETYSSERGFSFSSDVYSFGVMMLITLAGELTFKVDGYSANAYIPNPEHVRKLMEFKTNGGKYDIPESIPQDLSNIISQCLEKDPNARPNFQSILIDLEKPSIVQLCNNNYQTYIDKMKDALPTIT